MPTKQEERNADAVTNIVDNATLATVLKTALYSNFFIFIKSMCRQAFLFFCLIAGGQLLPWHPFLPSQGVKWELAIIAI